MSDKLNKCIFVLVIAFIVTLVFLTHISIDMVSNSNEIEKTESKSEAVLLTDIKEKLTNTSRILSSSSRIDPIYKNETNTDLTNNTHNYSIHNETNEESNFKNNNYSIKETSEDTSANDNLILMNQMLPRKALFGDRILPQSSPLSEKPDERKDLSKESLSKGHNEIETKVPSIALIPFPYRSLLLRKTRITTPLKSHKVPKRYHISVKNNEIKEKPINDIFSSSIDSFIDNNYKKIADNPQIVSKSHSRTTRLPHNYHQNFIKSRNIYRDYYSSDKYSIPTTKQYYNKNNYFSEKSDNKDNSYTSPTIQSPLEDEEYIDVSTNPLEDTKYGSKNTDQEYDDNKDSQQNSYHLYPDHKRPQKIFNENLYLPQESPQEQIDKSYDNNDNHFNRDHDYRDQNSGQIPHSVQEDYTEYPETRPTDHYKNEKNSYGLYPDHKRPQNIFNENSYSPQEQKDNSYDNNDNHFNRDHDYRDENSGQIPHSAQEDYTEYPETRPTDHYRNKKNSYGLYPDHKRPQNILNKNLYLPQEQKDNSYDNNDNNHFNRDHDYRDENSGQLPHSAQEDYTEYPETRPTDHYRNKKNSYGLYPDHKRPQNILNENLHSPQEQEDNSYDNNDNNHFNRDHDYRDENSGQNPHSVQEDYTEHPRTRPTHHYEDEHELTQYPESHTIRAPHDYYNSNEDNDNEIPEDEPYLESDLHRIPENIPILKNQRIPKLYEEHNPYVYSSERPEYESSPETTSNYSPYSEPDHFGSDHIEEDPDYHSNSHDLDDRPRDHPYNDITYEESPSNAPPLAVVSHHNQHNYDRNKELNHKRKKEKNPIPDHNNNDNQNNNHFNHNKSRERDRNPQSLNNSEGKSKSKDNKSKNNRIKGKRKITTSVNPLTQLFRPQTEVLSEIHTLIIPVRITYPSKLTSNSMRNVIENMLSRV